MTRGILLAGFAATAIGLMVFVPPIPQDQAFHRFADNRTILGVSNFFDVASNLAFVIVGAWGLARLRRAEFAEPRERWPYALFFSAVLLTGIGSAYYHEAPDDARLFWDRLPLGAAIGALLAIVVGERGAPRLGAALVVPLAAFGAGSVVYWRETGDLRLYATAQFYPMGAIVALCLAYRSRYTRGGDVLGVIAMYVLAKGFEALDVEIYRIGHVVSGHTLKHVAAGVAGAWLVVMLGRRRYASAAAPPM